MDFFVMNRHEGEGKQNIAINEQANIARLKKRIEKRKLTRIRQKEKRRAETSTAAEIISETNGNRRRTEQELDHDKMDNEIDPEPEITPEQIFETEQSSLDQLNNKGTNKKSKLNLKDIKGFTILGGENFDKKSKVKRVLPKWLSNPTIISVDLQNLQTKVSSMKVLDSKLRKKLRSSGIKYLFPVQAEVIPHLIQAEKDSHLIFPSDICVSAPTGSGKTLSFVLPIIQALKNYHIKRIRALVILPTQDLALQVFNTFKKYVQGTHVDVCCITGKSPFELEQTQLVIKNDAFGFISKVDILVCTAGRLVDHLKETKGFDLTHLKYLVIDEADRVLDNVQNDWLYHLEKHMYLDDIKSARVLNLVTLDKPRPPQKLLFSATLSQDPEKLQKLSLFQPRLFTSVVETAADNSQKDKTNDTSTFIGKYTTPKELTEKYIECSTNLKPLVLYEFIKQNNLTKTLIFLHSVETAHRLSILLQALFKDKLKIEDVGSQLDSNRRNALIDNFSKGNIDIIICTDRLARGIDLAGVQCVISYSPSKYLKTYIHRVGRTARAGESGLAVTLLHKSQLHKFLNLLQQGGKTNLEEIKIPEENLENLDEQYQEALKNLQKTVTKEGEEILKKIKSVKRRAKKRKLNSVDKV